MLFNSLPFLYFFLITLTIYWLLQRWVRVQNLFLLVASYVFYGYWNWRLLLILVFITLLNYSSAIWLTKLGQDTPSVRSQRKIVFYTSLALNLSILGFFKYFNFFSTSLTSLLASLGLPIDPILIEVILPLGISFYTLQVMGYLIDVNHGRQPACRDWLTFSVFVAYFPVLLSGPIERANRLIPQLSQPRRFNPDQAAAGFYLILWGIFKKLVIADNIGLVANQIFDNYLEYAGVDILIGILAFTIQLYADFSAYSDIARGVSRWLGIELVVNFKLPYFALNPTDFWQRWHISLSEWLRDYIFFPLRRTLLVRNRDNQFINLFVPPMVTMLASGLWHGAGWTFLLWGAYHGILMVLYRLIEKQPAHQDPWGGGQRRPVVLLKMLLMFCLTSLGWLLFRSTSVQQAVTMLTHISLMPSTESIAFLKELLFFGLPFGLIEVYQYIRTDLLVMAKLAAPLRLLFYGAMLAALALLGSHAAQEFIYVQF